MPLREEILGDSEGRGEGFLHVGGIQTVWPEQTVANCFPKKDQSNISGATSSLRILPLYMKVNEPLNEKRSGKSDAVWLLRFGHKRLHDFPLAFSSLFLHFLLFLPLLLLPFPLGHRFMWVLAEASSQELLLSIA